MDDGQAEAEDDVGYVDDISYACSGEVLGETEREGRLHLLVILGGGLIGIEEPNDGVLL